MAHVTHPESLQEIEEVLGDPLANGRVLSVEKETPSKSYNNWPNDHGVLIHLYIRNGRQIADTLLSSMWSMSNAAR